MKKRGKIYCSGCANLMIIPGTPPQCVATAEFVPGPLRKRIDVVGRVPAEKRNAHNRCPYRTSVSLRAWQLKRWILWRLNDGKDKSISAQALRDYPVSEEGKRAEAYREKTVNEGRLTAEEVTNIIDELVEDQAEDEDALLGDAGGGGFDESRASDSVGDEEVPD